MSDTPFDFPKKLIFAQGPAGAGMQPDGFKGNGGFILSEKLFPLPRDEIPERAPFQEAIILAVAVESGATPLPIEGVPSQCSPDRIPFDVTDRGNEMVLVEQAGGKSSLPKKSSPTFTEVDLPGEPAVGFPDRACQSRFGAWHRDEVDMIGHQTIGPDIRSVELAPPFQEVQVVLVIGLMKKGGQPAVPALRDMVWESDPDDAGHSGHQQLLSQLS